MDTHFRFRDVILLLTSLASMLGACNGCYAFSSDLPDPCSDVECEFGAQCVVSLDGSSARCQVSSASKRAVHTTASRDCDVIV